MICAAGSLRQPSVSGTGSSAVAHVLLNTLVMSWYVDQAERNVACFLEIHCVTYAYGHQSAGSERWGDTRPSCGHVP